MLVSMVALLSLLSLGSLTVLAVRGGQSAAGHDRFTSIARYSAESGIAAGMEFLRVNLEPGEMWSAQVSPYNETILMPAEILGNGIQPGEDGNPLSSDMNAWYEVEILNNENDPQYAAGIDSDGRVRLRARGHGPNGTVAVIEMEVALSGALASAEVPCPSYAQKNITAHGTGHNPCLGTIESTNVATFKPAE